MTDTAQDDPKPDTTQDDPADDAAETGLDPTATEHPTGEKQAAENAENEPPG